MISNINIVKNGVDLPVLTNPATPDNIQIGYEAINADGIKITGVLQTSNIQVIFGTCEGVEY